MSLENIYTRFLATPREDVLDDNASFHYITTAISINGPDAIIAQLAKENLKALKKRQEKVINSFETGNQLLLEVATEIQFLTSGCNWLPGLDDNFLADMIVRFPVVCCRVVLPRFNVMLTTRKQVHIVNFENGRIREVRIYWDQSNILKQLNVIGKSGRNWPVCFPSSPASVHC